MSAAVLYTPEVLAAAMGLAQWPWDESLPLVGEARSRACGSTLSLGLALDGEGRIVRLGLRPHACAVGQAAAHIFATAAQGRTQADVAAVRAALSAWLAGEGDEPDWPGLALLRKAKDYPARHGAILLAWDAALAALAEPAKAG
ncbi:iron-sulfur cluster assembly scaffold protein [Novosphingobium sp. SG720]|uniref:iron-sulfur cluster assembly scaffold protein n=1 Tax=Novosphingobium sp. SG720 TaxID=2586998 RepID=UPI0014477BA7|nr:iron-sulfur cluster assembly scaffold protein [Novosphingobium sp. SG720]NKJ41708.1 NifU-like protein involved in Fe-S cluster formation [Novosphingobium sp. SG720]